MITHHSTSLLASKCFSDLEIRSGRYLSLYSCDYFKFHIPTDHAF